MGRPKKIDTEIKGDIASLREGVTRKFFGLSDRVYNHILSSAVATKPCMACSIGPDGKHQPGKAKDEDGRCAMCHGSYLIADTQQRNWAVEQALPLVTNNKQVEVKVENKSILPELEAIIKGLDNKTLEQRLALLDVRPITDVEPIREPEAIGHDRGANPEGEVSPGSAVLDTELRKDA